MIFGTGGWTFGSADFTIDMNAPANDAWNSGLLNDGTLLFQNKYTRAAITGRLRLTNRLGNRIGHPPHGCQEE